MNAPKRLESLLLSPNLSHTTTRKHMRACVRERTCGGCKSGTTPYHRMLSISFLLPDGSSFWSRHKRTRLAVGSHSPSLTLDSVQQSRGTVAVIERSANDLDLVNSSGKRVIVVCVYVSFYVCEIWRKSQHGADVTALSGAHPVSVKHNCLGALV